VRRQRQSRRSRSFGLAIDPADIATTLLARGEFALLLGAMATSAGLDSRLSSFIAGYVLLLAVLGPIMAGQSGRLHRRSGWRGGETQGAACRHSSWPEDFGIYKVKRNLAAVAGFHRERAERLSRDVEAMGGE
jgi:hypothetical protein